MQRTPSEIVRQFFSVVRSGKAPERAAEFLAPHVAAHQVTAEDEQTIERSPANYAAHIREMHATYGQFELEVTELLADRDRVYVRWRQRGQHVGVLDGAPPTGKPIIELASAVYRVEAGKIVEYWMQIDREGVRQQLARDAAP